MESNPPEKTIRGSWFPTHSLKKREWMGHGALVALSSKDNRRYFNSVYTARSFVVKTAHPISRNGIPSAA
jgi:hypothetical protein